MGFQLIKDDVKNKETFTRPFRVTDVARFYSTERFPKEYLWKLGNMRVRKKDKTTSYTLYHYPYTTSRDIKQPVGKVIVYKDKIECFDLKDGKLIGTINISWKGGLPYISV